LEISNCAALKIIMEEHKLAPSVELCLTSGDRPGFIESFGPALHASIH
jgi:hypothetical protein